MFGTGRHQSILALAEDSGLVPSTHIMWLIIACNSNSRGFVPPGLYRYQEGTHVSYIYADTYKINHVCGAEDWSQDFVHAKQS